MENSKPQFRTSQGNNISFDFVMKDIIRFIKEDPKRYYKVIVGSDSMAVNFTSIITAIIVWRVGKGATYFLTKSNPTIFYSLHDRILAETINSIMLAQEVRSYLKDSIGEEFFWDGNDIHVDIGKNGETRKYIQEVTGIIKGFDFVPIIKPNAFCASTVADKHTV